ncbi:hypothetical protein AGLY_013756 [Aphis glycines]|uniref:Uncharacterized protein n=1 Tax=Aphis glycines TaxID=307491 RepID=A0A6G0T753_APHGL|nr:hypothetical protein AGLY_013756 [Aphis glycines]
MKGIKLTSFTFVFVIITIVISFVKTLTLTLIIFQIIEFYNDNSSVILKSVVKIFISRYYTLLLFCNQINCILVKNLSKKILYIVNSNKYSILFNKIFDSNIPFCNPYYLQVYYAVSKQNILSHPLHTLKCSTNVSLNRVSKSTNSGGCMWCSSHVEECRLCAVVVSTAHKLLLIIFYDLSTLCNYKTTCSNRSR